MPTVPNWIAKAVIVIPVTGHLAHLHPIKSWRATKTQVVVTTENGVEHRFYLDTLTKVGGLKSLPLHRVHLAAPDAPEVIAARREQVIISRAQQKVVLAFDRARLQDSGVTADVLLTKLDSIRMAATEAMASLADLP